MNNRSRLLLAASLAGALAAPGLVAAHDHAEKAAGGGEKAPCYGVNKCKGVGECSQPGHGCAGNNACKRQGWIEMEKDLCLKIDGGSLTGAEAKKK
jgi:uncharacterized membrane protein